MSGSLTNRGHHIALCLLSENNLLLCLGKCTSGCIYGYMPIRCALLMQYANGCFIAHFRVAWRKTKQIYSCTQTFIVVISTLFNLNKSCYACIHLRSVICNIMEKKNTPLSGQIQTQSIVETEVKSIYLTHTYITTQFRGLVQALQQKVAG